MPDLSTAERRTSWRGSRAYIVTALAASAANAGSLNRLSGSVSSVALDDVRDLLNSLTVVSLAGFFVQFVMARSLGQGHRLRMSGAFPLAAGSAAVTGTVSFLLVQSSHDYRFSVAFAIGIFTFLTIAGTAQAASLLVNGRWMPICAALAASTLVRLLLFEVAAFNRTPVRVMVALSVAQLVALAVLVSGRTDDLEERAFGLSQLVSVPTGTLGSYLLLIAMATIARAGSLGQDKSLLINASTPARSAFFLATSVAYAAFPMFCGLGLFSRELGQRFREAQLAVLVLVVVLLSLTGVGTFTGQSIRGIVDSSTPDALALTLGAAWGILALSLVPVLFYVAHNSRIGLLTAVPALTMVGAQIFATSASTLAYLLLASSLLLLAIVLVPAVMRLRPVVHPDKSLLGPGARSQSGDVVIVVPSYNSGEEGVRTVRSVHDAFTSEGITVAVIAVSDGSTDNSPAAFDMMDEPWFEHVALAENRGKGGALKAGFERARGSIVGFIDADGDIPPEMLPGMCRILRDQGAHVVFGSKWHPESEVTVSRSRRFVSRVQRLVQLVLFRIDIDDTQVGVKVFDGQMIADILPTLHEEGFSLDLEIFVSAVAHGYTRFTEVPVSITRTGGSTVSFGSILSTAVDVLRIYWRSRIALAYNAMAYENAQAKGL